MIYIIIYSALFGVTMKIADLLNEHNLKYFKGANIIFGILWGFFGALLILVDISIANALLAMILVYLIRMRIDYVNHSIATVIMILTFILSQQFDLFTFSLFASFFIVLGWFKDWYQYKNKNKSKALRFVYHIGIWFYPISGFVYFLVTKNILPFVALTIFNIFYALIKVYYQKKL